MVGRVTAGAAQDAESAAQGVRRPRPGVQETAQVPGAEPFSGASPWRPAAATTRPVRAPAAIRAVRATGPTPTASIRRVVISNRPREAPGVPCPVAWTSTGVPAGPRTVPPP
ncbi:hypothetical protein GCM10018793_62320 [Streptomyces sulfonofaciens]|uniref:Uncharacterized protein n=1 Tax=Streptomyces sulfonofaciens TaxID=68272 RepID=A0A919L934_9ACTN|nr:hypothetical protein GCM10018793_62320 [Streptomyces sulfonofaciens]